MGALFGGDKPTTPRGDGAAFTVFAMGWRDGTFNHFVARSLHQGGFSFHL